MNKLHQKDTLLERYWDVLKNKYSLSEEKIKAFQKYLELLLEWNKKFNLTAITNPSSIIHYHFEDSLAASSFIDFTQLTTIADIGTGAGFPGIPLKILFPHLQVILIEVNSKKRSFLAHVCEELKLDSVIFYAEDWRTFLRTSDYSIDLFCARASLQPEELIRIFKPSSCYKNAILMYWASQQWGPEKTIAPFIEKEISYTIDTIDRKFVFFNLKK